MMVNNSAFEISACANDDYYRFFNADAFTILSSISPQSPISTPTPCSYRIQPPIFSRKESSFVVLQEVNSHRSSRESSPCGRVSPHRGCGFKPHFRDSLSLESSPERETYDKIRRSRSSSSIDLSNILVCKMRNSVSPVRHKNSDAQMPMKRCSTSSTSRIIKSIFEINEKHALNDDVSKNNLKGRWATKDRSKLLAASTHTKHKVIVSRDINNTPRNLQTAFDIGEALCSKPTQKVTKDKTRRQNFVLEDKNKMKPKSKENMTNQQKRTPLSLVRATPEDSSKQRSPSKHNNLSVFLRNLSPKKPKNLSHKKILENSTRTAGKAIEKPLIKMDSCNDSAETSVPQTIPTSTAAKKSNLLAVTVEMGERGNCSEKSRLTRSGAEKRVTTSTLLNVIKNKIVVNDKEKSTSLSATDDKTCVVESPVGLPSIEPSMELSEPSFHSQSIPEVDDKKLYKKRQSLTDVHDSSSKLPPNSIPSSTEINSALLENSSNDEKTPARTTPLASNTDQKFPASLHLKAGEENPESGNSKSSLNLSKFNHGNQNRINKSTRLNNQSKIKPPVMLSTEPFIVNCQPDIDPKKWKNLRPDNVECVEVDSVEKKSNAVANTSRKPCCRNHFCCFCCKLKNHHNTGSAPSSISVKDLSWFDCRNGFRNQLTVLSCSKKIMQPSSTETKAEPSTGRTVFLKLKNCARCKSIAHNCFANNSIHRSLEHQFGKVFSRCGKCLCFNFNKQILVLESKQQRSALPKAVPRRQKWTKVFTDFPKLDPTLIDHASVMKGAIPLLPLPLAWICLILNVFLPGSGTLSSGVFCLFVGKPRFSINDSLASRFASLFVNVLIAGSQLFTVLFCLVGWGWSIWWGVIMLRVARKSKRTMLPVQGLMETRSMSVTNPDDDVERGPNL